MMEKELPGLAKVGVAWSWRAPIIQRRQSPSTMGVGLVWANLSLESNATHTGWWETSELVLSPPEGQNQFCCLC